MTLRVSKHSNLPCSVIFVNFYNFLNNDVIMSSFVSTGNIVNWVTTADGCVQTDDTTKPSPTSCEFVFPPPTPTRQNSFVPSASAVCIGLKLLTTIWHTSLLLLLVTMHGYTRLQSSAISEIYSDLLLIASSE